MSFRPLLFTAVALLAAAVHASEASDVALRQFRQNEEMAKQGYQLSVHGQLQQIDEGWAALRRDLFGPKPSTPSVADQILADQTARLAAQEGEATLHAQLLAAIARSEENKRREAEYQRQLAELANETELTDAGRRGDPAAVLRQLRRCLTGTTDVVGPRVKESLAIYNADAVSVCVDQLRDPLGRPQLLGLIANLAHDGHFGAIELEGPLEEFPAMKAALAAAVRSERLHISVSADTDAQNVALIALSAWLAMDQSDHPEIAQELVASRHAVASFLAGSLYNEAKDPCTGEPDDPNYTVEALVAIGVAEQRCDDFVLPAESRFILGANLLGSPSLLQYLPGDNSSSGRAVGYEIGRFFAKRLEDSLNAKSRLEPSPGRPLPRRLLPFLAQIVWANEVRDMLTVFERIEHALARPAANDQARAEHRRWVAWMNHDDTLSALTSAVITRLIINHKLGLLTSGNYQDGKDRWISIVRLAGRAALADAAEDSPYSHVEDPAVAATLLIDRAAGVEAADAIALSDKRADAALTLANKWTALDRDRLAALVLAKSDLWHGDADRLKVLVALLDGATISAARSGAARALLKRFDHPPEQAGLAPDVLAQLLRVAPELVRNAAEQLRSLREALRAGFEESQGLMSLTDYTPPASDATDAESVRRRLVLATLAHTPNLAAVPVADLLASVELIARHAPEHPQVREARDLLERYAAAATQLAAPDRALVERWRLEVADLAAIVDPEAEVEALRTALHHACQRKYDPSDVGLLSSAQLSDANAIVILLGKIARTRAALPPPDPQLAAVRTAVMAARGSDRHAALVRDQLVPLVTAADDLAPDDRRPWSVFAAEAAVDPRVAELMYTTAFRFPAWCGGGDGAERSFRLVPNIDQDRDFHRMAALTAAIAAWHGAKASDRARWRDRIRELACNDAPYPPELRTDALGTDLTWGGEASALLLALATNALPAAPTGDAAAKPADTGAAPEAFQSDPRSVELLNRWLDAALPKLAPATSEALARQFLAWARGDVRVPQRGNSEPAEEDQSRYDETRDHVLEALGRWVESASPARALVLNEFLAMGARYPRAGNWDGQGLEWSADLAGPLLRVELARPEIAAAAAAEVQRTGAGPVLVSAFAAQLNGTPTWWLAAPGLARQLVEAATHDLPDGPELRRRFTAGELPSTPEAWTTLRAGKAW